MIRYMLKYKLIAVAIALVFCAVSSTQAIASDGRNQGRREGNRHVEVQHRPAMHGTMVRHGGDSRGDGHRDGWIWGGIALSAFAIGAIIASMPRQHDVVYAEPAPVVAQPVIVTQAPVATVIQPQWSSQESVVISVPNIRGGYTPVVLTRCQGGYRGPQGEFYAGNPTMEQLIALYGR